MALIQQELFDESKSLIFCQECSRRIAFTKLQNQLLADNLTKTECFPSELVGHSSFKTYLTSFMNTFHVCHSTSLNIAFQVNARLELEREDVRTAVRGEFSSALEGLTQERAGLLNQVSELRLKLAELQSDKETVERRWRLQAEEEAEKIHAK